MRPSRIWQELLHRFAKHRVIVKVASVIGRTAHSDCVLQIVPPCHVRSAPYVGIEKAPRSCRCNRPEATGDLHRNRRKFPKPDELCSSTTRVASANGPSEDDTTDSVLLARGRLIKADILTTRHALGSLSSNCMSSVKRKFEPSSLRMSLGSDRTWRCQPFACVVISDDGLQILIYCERQCHGVGQYESHREHAVICLYAVLSYPHKWSITKTCNRRELMTMLLTGKDMATQSSKRVGLLLPFLESQYVAQIVTRSHSGPHQGQEM